MSRLPCLTRKKRMLYQKINIVNNLTLNITNVRLVDYERWPEKPRGRGAKAAGLRYQDRVNLQLEKDCLSNKNGYGWAYIAGPWIKYFDGNRNRHAQPDGLLLNLLQGRVIIVEIKHTYCAKAWWQLCAQYAPLIARLFPATLWEYSLLAIANSVSPQPTPTPGCYVNSWAANPKKDIGILRLAEKTLPSLR